MAKQSNPLNLQFKIKKKIYYSHRSAGKRKNNSLIEIACLHGSAAKIASTVYMALSKEERNRKVFRGITRLAGLMIKGPSNMATIKERLIRLYKY